MAEPICIRQFTVATGGISANRVLKLNSSGQVTHCGAADNRLGFSQIDNAAGSLEHVKLTNYGVVPVLAAGSISVSNVVYQAADGKVSSSGSVRLGIALETGSDVAILVLAD